MGARSSRHTRGARFRYRGASRHFNAAWIGIESIEGEKAAATGSTTWEKALSAVQQKCAQLCGTGGDRVTVHHNTTAGVQRVFSRINHLLGRQVATLLTTDLEYPGIIASVDENWQGRMVMASVADMVWGRRGREVERALQRAFLLAEPDVVYVSHVARASGFELPLKAFASFVREVNPRTVIIADGAQALGNIAVDSEVLDLVDFYVASGHKWLCGRTTLGIVYSAPAWRLHDPAQAYSRRSGSGGTGSEHALRSLAKSLDEFLARKGGKARMPQVAKHNAALARYFLDRLEEVGCTVRVVSRQRNWMLNGIVSILGPDSALLDRIHQAGLSVSHLVEEQWRGPEGGDAPGSRFLVRVSPTGASIEVNRQPDFRNLSAPLPPGGVLRVCFHVYHSRADVDRLVQAVHKR